MVNVYNNTYTNNQNETCWCKTKNTYFNKENDKKCLKFKIGDHLNINIFLQMTMFQIGLKFLWLKKLKTLCHDLKGEETVGAFYERELQKKKSKGV